MLKFFKLKSLFLLTISLRFFQGVHAQDDIDDLYALSLEDLMNVTIESASKKKESLFEAPFSSYSISKDEIARTGVTSIPEALRLCPEVIVRETSNGNYDIHIRGFDNLTRKNMFTEQVNLITLVMIDGMPIFNYFQGGTFWEALPIDLLDVERIEVVKGPSAALFGPNAVAGVINIITKTNVQEGVSAQAKVEGGVPQTIIGNARIGYQLNDKLSMTLSGNYQTRDRMDTRFYRFAARAYEDEANTDSQGGYPRGNKSLDRYGMNLFTNYKLNNNVNFNLSMGLQDNHAKRAYVDRAELAITTNENNSRYIDFTGNVHGLFTKLSYINGFDQIRLGTRIATTKMDYNSTNFVINYPLQISDNFSLRPEFNYRNTIYNDNEYIKDTVNSPAGGLLNGEQILNLYAGSLSADYNPIDQLRLIAAARVDKFESKDDPEFSYQFAGTYNLNDQFLFRLAHSRSTSGAFMFQSFSDITYYLGDGFGMSNVFINRLGDRNMKLATNMLYEFGVRVNLSNGLSADATLFHQQISNMNVPVFYGMDMSDPAAPLLLQQYMNLSTKGLQNGMTLALNYFNSDVNLQIRPFVTFQETKVEDLPSDFFTSDFSASLNAQGIPIGSIEDGIKANHNSTPSWYGGLAVNYSPIAKVNFNLNGYFFGDQQLYHLADPDGVEDAAKINSKIILNTKVSYEVNQNFQVYFNGRNITNSDNPEFYGTDITKAQFLFGLNVDF